MTQRDRVLQMLQAAGSRGVHTFELRREFIGNPSQRIAELEALGHKISHTRERLHGDAIGSRYKLISSLGDRETANGGAEPGLLGRASSQAASSPTEAAPALFDPREIHQPRGAYDDRWDDAA